MDHAITLYWCIPEITQQDKLGLTRELSLAMVDLYLGNNYVVFVNISCWFDGCKLSLLATWPTYHNYAGKSSYTYYKYLNSNGLSNNDNEIVINWISQSFNLLVFHPSTPTVVPLWKISSQNDFQQKLLVSIVHTSFHFKWINLVCHLR